MPNPRKLPSGAWQYRLMVDGTRHAVTRRLKSEAVRDGETLRGQLEAGYRPDDRVTLTELCDTYITSRRDLAPRTIDEYRSSLRRLTGHQVMGMRLVDVRPADLRRLVADLQAGGLAGTGIRQLVVPLRSALSQAETDMLLVRTPWRGVSLPSDRSDRKPHVLTPDEYRRLLDAAGPYALDLRTLVQTGLRWGEYSALTTASLGVGALHVTQSRGQQGALGPTKTSEPRTIPIAAGLAQQLRALDGPTLFHPDGQDHWKYTWWRRNVWDPTIRAAQIDARPHDLRHTAASWLLNRAHVDVKTVATILGHTRLQTTMGYLHTSPQHLTDAAAALEELAA